MNAKDKRIIELETEVKFLREQLDFERAKPAEVKYVPSPYNPPIWPNTAGWESSRGPFNPHYLGLVNNGAGMNHCDNNIAYLSTTGSKVTAE